MQVVAALAVRGHSVLAARRTTPPGWEFPGGKIEPGETSTAALERECHEELGVTVRCTTRLATVTDARIVLQLWLVDMAGEPVAHEHEQLRWVSPHEFDALAWLPVDRALLGVVRSVLGTVQR